MTTAHVQCGCYGNVGIANTSEKSFDKETNTETKASHIAGMTLQVWLNASTSLKGFLLEQSIFTLALLPLSSCFYTAVLVSGRCGSTGPGSRWLLEMFLPCITNSSWRPNGPTAALRWESPQLILTCHSTAVPGASGSTPHLMCLSISCCQSPVQHDMAGPHTQTQTASVTGTWHCLIAGDKEGPGFRCELLWLLTPQQQRQKNKQTWLHFIQFPHEEVKFVSVCFNTVGPIVHQFFQLY